ncbi:MAG: hypothetical protein P9L92_05425 [Candidatus Electryonea clarkiae]|nr:hypothetical protein [Candidatus Electryonea clarkiae]
MSILLVRPFDIMFKGERYPVLMVRVDNAGSRSYAIPAKEDSEHDEPLKWIGERWVEKVLPYDINP